MSGLDQQNNVNDFVGKPNCSSFKPSGTNLACMVNSEIGAVLAVMRRNVRWGVHYATDDDDHIDHSLIISLKNLRKRIFSWHNQWHSIDPVVYLQPFLDVIKSDETGAPITGVALSSVYKILNLEILDSRTMNVNNALHIIVDAVTSCRFEVTDPASEEVVLMKILQVLLACMKNEASVSLTNHHVCSIVNTCFQIVHQASSKSELLQRISRHTMHELVRCIFLHLPEVDDKSDRSARGTRSFPNADDDATTQNQTLEEKQLLNGYATPESETETDAFIDAKDSISSPMMDPYGVPSMVEILHFLCSLLNVMENIEIESSSNPIAYHEDVPLFALGLINSAVELGGVALGNHPELLSLIQEEVFYNLMQFGLSMSPLILSTVCSIVLNLYHHLRTKLKLQLEAFISKVLLRIAESEDGASASYQQQEVAMEALVDFCRQPNFVTEMYANYDCDISCSNVFEGIINLLSKSAFPVNRPLSPINTLALDGLIALVQCMSERISHESSISGLIQESEENENKPFWTLTCQDYNEPVCWVPFVRNMKQIKTKLTAGIDHLNKNPKKGFEFLQELHLLPDKHDPGNVAHFFRYATGLDKSLIGDVLGSHDEFSIKVLYEFARTFDFQEMHLDTALRVFLETFRLPGESQKIQRVLEAFAERYFEQSQNILVDKDAALLLSYSLIMLNTDQHNAQVKKKMTEQDFIRNNRSINGGEDLPRDFLSELYRSICENEIRMVPDQNSSFPNLTRSNWITLTYKAKQTSPFIISHCESHLDSDMFNMLLGPTIAAFSVIFDHADQDNVLQSCIDGLFGISKLSASCNNNSGEVLDELILSLCKFTTLLHPSFSEKYIIYFADDTKAKMATEAVFTLANLYGDKIRSGWKKILDCLLSLHRANLLPPRLASDATDNLELSDHDQEKKPSLTPPPKTTANFPSRKSSGIMGRFSSLLYLNAEEPEPPQPSQEQVAARQITLQTIQKCQIETIFSESKFLQAEALSELVSALVRRQKHEETAIFCVELLIAISLNNRDRIMLIWDKVYDHIANIVEMTTMPCKLVEKAVFGLLKICQRLLPYKENLTDELLKSLQLILKLDARVADAYCEQITQEVKRIVKANANQIRSHMGWRTIISLLSITARHPEASEAGFETLSHIMSNGAHLSPANYVLCLNAARQFSESRVGSHVSRSVKSLDLMAGSVSCLVKWFRHAKKQKSLQTPPKEEETDDVVVAKMSEDILEMWMRLVQGIRKVCSDEREEVRNHAINMLLRCLTGLDGIQIPNVLWQQCFDLVIFTLIDEILEMAQQKQNQGFTEGSIILSLKVLAKTFLQSLQDISQSASFCQLWLKFLGYFEKCMKMRFRGKKSEDIHELIPELLKNTLLVMKTSGILVVNDPVGGDSFWKLTWGHVDKIVPNLQLEVFTSEELEKLKEVAR